MIKVRINTGQPHDVLVGHGLLAQLGEALLQRHARCTVALVSDETVYGHYGHTAKEALADAGFRVAPCTFPAGGEQKNLRTVDTLLERFAQQGLTRTDAVVALGGGTVGDIAGFAASIYLRGIAYAQVPTTLLAAVDASIGGKTGADLPHGSNLVGTFWQPCLVLCDCDTFDTLPYEHFLDGVAESLKYGIICDKTLFESVAQGALDGDCVDLVARCISIKASYVTVDERNTGDQQLLTLGYTMGNAVRAVSNASVTHAHCMGIGMVGATRVAEALGLCTMGCAGLLMAVLDRLGLACETSYSVRELAEASIAEKRRMGASVTVVLPEAIGRCVLYPVKLEALPQLFRLAKGERT